MPLGAKFSSVSHWAHPLQEDWGLRPTYDTFICQPRKNEPMAQGVRRNTGWRGAGVGRVFAYHSLPVVEERWGWPLTPLARGRGRPLTAGAEPGLAAHAAGAGPAFAAHAVGAGLGSAAHRWRGAGIDRSRRLRGAGWPLTPLARGWDWLLTPLGRVESPQTFRKDLWRDKSLPKRDY